MSAPFNSVEHSPPIYGERSVSSPRFVLLHRPDVVDVETTVSNHGAVDAIVRSEAGKLTVITEGIIAGEIELC